MAQSENELNVTVNPSEGSDKTLLVIQHNEAEKIYERQKINLSGIITTPSEFLKKREGLIDPKQGHVTFDKAGKTIVLVTEDEDFFQKTITGKLKMNPFLAKLKINSDEGYTIGDLKKLFRYQKRHFEDKAKHSTMMTQLQNYTAKVTKTVNERDNRQGDKAISIEQQIDSFGKDYNFDFDLFTEIFEGMGKQKISFKVEKEAVNGSVLLYLVNDDWDEILDDAIEAIYSIERAIFSEFAIVNKD
jgi:hypothetical protein